MALTATNDAPRVRIEDRETLLPTRNERVLEALAPVIRLVPSICRVAKEHAQKMTSTGTVTDATVLGTGMHDAQIVEKLDVALLTVDFCAEALG